jgi:hypothetical protein
MSYGDIIIYSICRYGSQRGNTWPWGYTPCWQVYTNKTRIMPFISTKSVACMSTSWLQGKVYTAKSCKGKKRVPDALNLGLVSYGRQPWQKTSALQDSRGLGMGLKPHPGKDSWHEIWRNNSQIPQLAEASEEGKGPHRAVEPMMMMMMICSYIILNVMFIKLFLYIHVHITFLLQIQ